MSYNSMATSAGVLVLSCLLTLSAIGVQCSTAKSYVIYLGSMPQGVDKYKLVESHKRLLKPVLKSTKAVEKALFYSYTHNINGFAAKLLPEQAELISSFPGVVSVFPNRKNHLHTTRSWEFLGLESQGEVPAGSLWNKSEFGKNMTIGILDTGVWPESASFNDDSLDPVPNKWKGKCMSGTYFNASNCNKKLIGARFYLKAFEQENGPLNTSATREYKSPRDKNGHGTHTASVAGGRFVSGANLFGLGNGTAKGGASLARLAIYKVCWPKASGETSCYDADILAAIDDAIQDGVDVLSISIGAEKPLESSEQAPQLFEDGISVGAYHAVQKGILVVCSAGNRGPGSGSVVNVAPWILTVAATSIDREFTSYATLGDNTTFKGASLSDSSLNSTQLYPLVFGGDVANSSATSSDSLLCMPGSLDPEKVSGKIVVCLTGSNTRVSKGEAVRLVGGVGMILANSPSEGSSIVADAHVLPAANVDAEAGAAILAYLNSSSSPTATITPASTLTGIKPAPKMASFSSQGPNPLIPDILKPDVTAPGVSILSAFTEASSPTGLPSDTRMVRFNVESGTSMACPHISAVGALLKALHPDWSPAAIKSAIMTTAKIRDNREQLILGHNSQIAGPFNYGSGHVNPNAAANPGLVYDSSPDDYLLLLCSLKFNSTVIKTLSGRVFSCPSQAATTGVASYNYPSIAISSPEKVATVSRTLTNVANCSSTYQVFVKPPSGVTVSVRPPKLAFSSSGEKLSFSVTLTSSQQDRNVSDYSFGYLVWSDGKHQVRSSIAVKLSNKDKIVQGVAESHLHFEEE